MSAFSQSPTPGAGREAANNQLMQLYYDTLASDPLGAQAILQYIQSGWMSPVPQALAPRVSAITGQAVGSGTGDGSGPTSDYGRTPPGGAQGGFQDTRANIAAQGGTPLPDPPSGLPGMGLGLAYGAYGGTGAQSQASPLGGAASGTGYGYEGPPPGNPFAAVMDEFGRPAGQNYVNTVAGDQAAVAAQRGRGGNAPPPAPVSAGTNPAGGSTAVNPLFPGAAGGGSAVQDAGYQAAMGGDQNALDLVLGKLLSNFGVDVTRPGLFTGSLVKTVAPYLETFLRYYGLNGEGAPALDQAKSAADKFGGMLGSAGTFGQIQDSAKGLLGTAGDLLGNARGALAQPLNQQGMISDILGMLTAGDNGIRQQSLQGQLLGQNYDYGQEQLAGSSGGYMDFLRKQAQTGKLPGGDLLAQILAGAGR
jgi:hypothetical protein